MNVHKLKESSIGTWPTTLLPGNSKGIYREDYSFSLLSILRLTSGCHFDSSCFAVAAVCSITFCACSGFCQPRARAPFAHALGDSSMNIHKQVVQTLIRIIEVSDNRGSDKRGYTVYGMLYTVRYAQDECGEDCASYALF